MIVKRIREVMRGMHANGEDYAKARCYHDKVATKHEAYILGFIDACETFISLSCHLGLDNEEDTCYTSEKALKK
jgi:hypothetical protein